MQQPNVQSRLGEAPAGVEFVTVAERPELWGVTFERVAWSGGRGRAEAGEPGLGGGARPPPTPGPSTATRTCAGACTLGVSGLRSLPWGR